MVSRGLISKGEKSCGGRWKLPRSAGGKKGKVDADVSLRTDRAGSGRIKWYVRVGLQSWDL